MKVGDYIRTTNWGIARVHKIIDGKCKFIKNRNNRITPYFDKIGEPSPNIIDLIEKRRLCKREICI